MSSRQKTCKVPTLMEFYWGDRRQTREPNFRFDISVMTVISTIRGVLGDGSGWSTCHPGIGSPLKQASLSTTGCLLNGEIQLQEEPKGDVFQGEGKSTGPKEGKCKGSPVLLAYTPTDGHVIGEVWK